jgi:hypothetical protein
MLKINDIIGKEMMLRSKDDTMFRFTHLITYYAAKIHAKITKNNAFFERYFHTIDEVIYVPRKLMLDITVNRDHYEATIRHEYCHLLQSRQEKFYKAKYLLSSHYRMLFELEAYCHNLAASVNYSGAMPEQDVKDVVIRNLDCGSIYMMQYPSKPFLDNDQIVHWHQGVRHLVDIASRSVADEFTAHYLRDYGRLPLNKLKELERAVARLLAAI